MHPFVQEKLCKVSLRGRRKTISMNREIYISKNLLRSHIQIRLLLHGRVGVSVVQVRKVACRGLRYKIWIKHRLQLHVSRKQIVRIKTTVTPGTANRSEINNESPGSETTLAPTKGDGSMQRNPADKLTRPPMRLPVQSLHWTCNSSDSI